MWWGKGRGAGLGGGAEGPGSLRNSERARACLGAGARFSDDDGVTSKEEFQAFKTGVSLMGREWNAKSVVNRGLTETSVVWREHASIVKRP